VLDWLGGVDASATLRGLPPPSAPEGGVPTGLVAVELPRGAAAPLDVPLPERPLPDPLVAESLLLPGLALPELLPEPLLLAESVLPPAAAPVADAPASAALPPGPGLPELHAKVVPKRSEMKPKVRCCMLPKLTVPRAGSTERCAR
jgi:hypothetical protein